jgi:hypothetical protein
MSWPTDVWQVPGRAAQPSLWPCGASVEIVICTAYSDVDPSEIDRWVSQSTKDQKVLNERW